jgi:parallel beta-helix repeat protein/predicted outer membrane repeat protein
MNRKISFVAFLLLFINGLSLATNPEYRQGEVLVRFISDGQKKMSLSDRTKILNSYVSGSRAVKDIKLVAGLTRVTLPTGTDVLSATQQFQNSPLVVYAQPNYVYKIATIPNDPMFNQQWALNNTGQTGGTVDADIDAPQAWDIYTGGTNIIVGVVDTGIDYNHPDLKPNMWVNPGEIPNNGIDDDADGYVDDVYGINAITNSGNPMDDHFHGTHCAGIIGAVGNNGIGVSGVNWHVRLMALKIFDWQGAGGNTADILQCFDYAIAKHVNILSNSWGGYGFDQALYDGIAAVQAAGILFVAAAGNESNNNDGAFSAYPASFDLDNIISVMATDHKDQVASFSNYGLTTVDLGAPGVDILSTFPTYETNDMNSFGFSTNYGTISGTSMSTPFVSGASALIWSFVPNLDYASIRDVILNSADPLPSLSGRCVTGARLNLFSAISAVNTRVLDKNTGKMYRKIQQAIDDPLTLNSHTIIVDKGPLYLKKMYFFETVDFKGKRLTVRSGDVDHPTDETIYPEKVMISGKGKNKHTVSFIRGENASAVLKGFTIADGYATGVELEDSFGGGIYLYNSSPTISDCIITNNQAVLDGGGIYCDGDSNPTITNCTVSDNYANSRDGGGIYCYDSSPLIKNCLVVANRAARDGGGIYLNGPLSIASQVRIFDCTISDNHSNDYDGLGGALYCYYSSKPQVRDCIISNNNGYAIYEEDLPSDPQVTFCLFYNNPDGDWYDADTLHVYTGAVAVNSLAEASDNIEGDPLFVLGKLGSYYLSQLAAGQLADSVAVDAGSAAASSLGMNIYSTRTDNIKDSGFVDMGYHYNDPCAAVMFTLTTSISPALSGWIDPVNDVPHSYPQYAQVQLTATADSNSYWFKAWHGTDDDGRKDVNENAEPVNPQLNIVTMDSDKSVAAEFEKINVSLTVRITSGQGSISVNPPPNDPRRDLYRRGTVVTITVTPANPSNRIKWIGSDDDTSRQLVNTVTMTANKIVNIELRQPRTLIVGGGGIPGAYTNFGDAIRGSQDGDTIVVHEGRWTWTWSNDVWLIQGKDITIRSTNPDNPTVVANTVLLNTLWFEDVTRNTVVAGITISDLVGYPGTSGDGTQAGTLCDGIDGGDVFGVGLLIGFMNRFSISFGADLLPLVEASPTFINCVFQNLNAEGGNGGNNGCGCPPNAAFGFDYDGGWAGRAYGGAMYIGVGCKPLYKNCIIQDCNALGGDSGNGCYHPGSWGDSNPPPGSGWSWFFGPYDFPSDYTGKGGGAYIDVNSAPEFIDCSFINNLARGGSTGQATAPGVGRPLHYRIDSYGGAVYCAAASKPKFTNCRFVDNRVATTTTLPNWRWTPGPGEVALAVDKYIGFGAAVAIEGERKTFDGVPYYATASKPFFENCTFENNISPNGNGGAIHCQYGVTGQSSETVINKCTLTGNQAYHGGAIYSVDSRTRILESIFNNNSATSAVGEGGAIHVTTGEVEISDSNIFDNSAVFSGGGLFLSDSNALVWNCLLTGNQAGRDGGGISAYLYSDCNIVNTTISDNIGGQFGGGVFCAYNSFTRILDSIIWGNMATSGHQIAVASDDPYNPEPSVVEVSYSSIGPRYSYLVQQQASVFGSGSSSGEKLIESSTIYNDISSSGKAKVVITLADPVDLKKQTDWNSSSSMAALHDEIHNRQQAVLSTLTTGEFTKRYQYDNVAAFSGEITLAGLNKLISNPQVYHIEPTRPLVFQMRQALALSNDMSIRPTYGGAHIGIAICDSGFDYSHPDLGNNDFPNSKIVGGYDFGSMDSNPQQEGAPHGTACAGIAAGSIDNVGDYIGGVAYQAGIYGLKISVGTDAPLSDAALAAWDWCITHKNDNANYPILVISNSWRTGPALNPKLYNDPNVAAVDYPGFAAAADTATAAGITILAASGNDGNTTRIGAPAALRNVLAVGAVYDTSDAVTPYSNTSPLIDIFAPGDPIYTTDIVGAAGYTSGNFVPDFGGTSAATPFAAGAVAVLQQAAKTIMGHYLTPEQVRTSLVSSGDLVTDTKVDITKPRVNIGNAIALLSGPPIYLELRDPIHLEQNCTIRYNWWNPATFTWSPASHNLSVNDDPLFIDGYYLSQTAAGQAITSNAVDAGSTDAYTAGKYRHTTRNDLVVEDFDSIVDMGYHYIRHTEFKGDFNYDGRVDGYDLEGNLIMNDLVRLLRHWLDDQCEFPDWCYGTDLNQDGVVNNKDYAIYAANWGKKETTPPLPDPMTWEIMPKLAALANWAEMTATKAKDAYGGTIEYYFQRTDANGYYRDWDPNRAFTDTSLVLNNTYGYRVKARDARGNETGWSVIGYVVVAPPKPDPMTWELVPTSAPAATWATMTATEAKDTYGGPIKYYFQRTNASGIPDGFYRNWDSNRAFTNYGLVLNKTYGYRVKARDARGNETAWSVIGYVEVGKEPPTPPTPPLPPSNLTALALSQTQIRLNWTDNSNNETGFKIERFTGAQPFVEIATVGANVTTYTNSGLTANTTYTYRVRAYNSAGNSDYSNTASATTLPPIPVPQTPVMLAPPNDPNSGEYYSNGYWYHRVVATVPGLGGTPAIWFRFQCISDIPALSSGWVNATGSFVHPIYPSFPSATITVNGTTVTYVIVVKQGGSFGHQLTWRVCSSYSADGSNSVCSTSLVIPPH